MPACVQAQATKSIPLGKNIGIDTRIPVKTDTSAVDRAVQHQLEQARQQNKTKQSAQHKQVSSRESLQLYQEDIVNDRNYVSTPQGDIRKGSWQACEYFYNWDKHQKDRSSMTVEQYQAQRDIVLLTFGISADYCSVLAQYRNPAQLTPLQLADNTAPDIAHADLHLSLTVPATSQQSKGERASWIKELRATEYVQTSWPPRKIKRYLKEYMQENCTAVQEALEMRNKGKSLRAKQRLALSGYDSLCQAYENTFGQSAEVCLQPATCEQAPSNPKQEESFLAIYNAAANR